MSEFISNLIDTINTYYSFALIVYAALLYGTQHSRFFLGTLILATLLLAVWAGYALHTFINQHFQRYGFRVLQNSMSYDVSDKDRHILRYSTRIKAETNHLFTYPLAHQWTGSGAESMPVVTSPHQQILGHLDERAKETTKTIAPYKLKLANGGEWQYWFVAFTPPLQKGDVTEINYSQEFDNKGRKAKPCLYYYVSKPIKNLELNVKFPTNQTAVKVTAHYFKSSDSRRPYACDEVRYDADNNLARWTIKHPKVGYCYQLDW